MSLRFSTGVRLAEVAVVGGGFCGAMVALNLLRRTSTPVRISIFEKAGRIGPGVAYRTPSLNHLLNVPARLMSAWPDEPDHFADWLRDRDPSIDPAAFAPRKLYGDYLESQLREASTLRPSSLATLKADVVDGFENAAGGFTLTTRDGELHRADAVVLALGNPAPADPIAVPDELRADRRYVTDPWTEDALGGLEPNARVVLLGTGLSAVDMIVDAQARGLNGPITAVSRHGMFPQVHAPSSGLSVAPPFADRELPRTARRLLREFREVVMEHEGRGGSWRDVVDSIRPRIPAVWQALDATEQKRFVRHLGAYWEVHRHRLAPRVNEVVELVRNAGGLSIVAGRVARLSADAQGVALRIDLRGERAPMIVRADRVINCTGPSKDFRASCSALWDALVARGLATFDPLAMGIAADGRGALIDRNGNASDRLFTLGPALKGRLWETTAVRELRQQAAELGVHLAGFVESIAGRLVPAPHWNSAERPARSGPRT